MRRKVEPFELMLDDDRHGTEISTIYVYMFNCIITYMQFNEELF